MSLLIILALMLPGCSKKSDEASEPTVKQNGTVDDSASAKKDAEKSGKTSAKGSTAAGDVATSSPYVATGSEPAVSTSDVPVTNSGDTGSDTAAVEEAKSASSDLFGTADILTGSLREFTAKESAKVGSDAAGWEYGAGDTFGTDSGIFEASDEMWGDDGVWDGEDTDWDIDPIDPIVPDYPEPSAGLLTSGEWNDNLHFDFLKNLLNNGQQDDYSRFFKAWDLTPFSRLTVHVSTGETTIVSGSAIGTKNVNNATVSVYSADGTLLWQSKTDNKGMTYAFYRLKGGDYIPSVVKVSSGSFYAEKEVTSADLLDAATLEVYLESSYAPEKKLDLMFVIDTTGSMGDEIAYLQKELEDVIKRVEEQNANMPIRLSCNFYRDLEDEYVVRSNQFSEDIASQLILLNAEYASGGGDYEEAVELALEDAVNKHAWDDDSIKLMFMVLDAPPHNTDEVKAQLKSTITDAIAKGIRIIPIASSGVDKSTEFLLRTFAMTTGGTYTFLTDHSGIGGSHIEPTIGDYEVENLNNMIVRIISEYLN